MMKRDGTFRLPRRKVTDAPRFAEADNLTGSIIAAGIEVHRALGPGLLESDCDWTLTKELELRGPGTSTEQRGRIEYKGFVRDEPLRHDVLVGQCVLVEVKAVQAVLAALKAQLLTYMKLLDVPLDLILNFHQVKLDDGISRLIRPGANR